MSTFPFTWRRISGEWVVQAPPDGLVHAPGETVTVAKRNGQTATATLGEPIEGTVCYRVATQPNRNAV